MKTIEDLKQSLDEVELTTHLEYNKMIDVMLYKRGIEDETLQQENEIIQERLQFLQQNK